MGFLRDILGRPEHEHAMLVLPVDILQRVQWCQIYLETLEEISEFLE